MKSGRRRRDVARVMIQGVDNIGMVKISTGLFLLEGAGVKRLRPSDLFDSARLAAQGWILTVQVGVHLPTEADKVPD
jgi:hypothetical protein